MPTPSAALSLQRLCTAHTLLAPADIAVIQRCSDGLPLFAELAQADVFIDCLTHASDVAVVVAQASPGGGRSLYRSSVVGQMALRENEPGVLESLRTGESTLSRRGITQEGIPVRQRVVPIRSDAGATIGALILEQDISAELQQEARIGLLSETTGHLTELILGLAMKTQTLPALLHEGVLIVDPTGCITYANPAAIRFIRDLGGPDDPVGAPVVTLPLEINPSEWTRATILSRELHGACAAFRLHAVPIDRENQALGQIILLRDVTELRSKEKELMVKSAVIREMHHRVKNNLQTIASLLRLQSRRAKSPEVQLALDDALGRIASIATVHEVLAKDGIELVDLHQMAADIAGLVQGSLRHPDHPVAVAVEGDAPIIPADKATSVALILHEVLQNALDHAFVDQANGRITIRVDDLGGHAQVTVADDGCGLPERFSLPAGSNLGLQIVQTLVDHHLGGELQVQRRAPVGTEVIIRFPTHEGDGRRGADHRTAG